MFPFPRRRRYYRSPMSLLFRRHPIIWLLLVVGLALIPYLGSCDGQNALIQTPVPYAAYESFPARVIRVADGDTITVSDAYDQQHRIRFSEIDAPESPDQPYHDTATQYVIDRIAQRPVTIVVRDTDRYGRIVGEIILPDGNSLNRELVAQGLAWWYHQYSNDETIGVLEAQARAARRGLWADPSPVPPWDWRRGQR
ncbi:thermonuclease family protein [Geoalkalibacter halelectricus]|uniref:thermonuclease family protein n=1 Tax=Geoalkalibacter halelectricus TaxID=2847045 RepID=UPI0026708D47|nr:thermonuclease family protein [Geoalkalibacter halelectricus]MDO3380460.1 thermonuclease family protein [Geoalkalibacter halelectricus]